MLWLMFCANRWRSVVLDPNGGMDPAVGDLEWNLGFHLNRERPAYSRHSRGRVMDRRPMCAAVATLAPAEIYVLL